MVHGKPSLIGTSHALRFFPTLVWKADLTMVSAQRINHEILGRRVDLRQFDEFLELVSCINETATTMLSHLKIGYHEFEFTACWANVNAPGAAHPIHCHPNNFLSGVYYVKTHDGANTINFHDPRNQTGVIRPPVTELTAENTDQVVVKVTDGTLLVFPAWLPHSADANLGVGERISISFNIMYSSFTESMSGPLWDAHPKEP